MKRKGADRCKAEFTAFQSGLAKTYQNFHHVGADCFTFLGTAGWRAQILNTTLYGLASLRLVFFQASANHLSQVGIGMRRGHYQDKHFTKTKRIWVVYSCLDLQKHAAALELSLFLGRAKP